MLLNFALVGDENYAVPMCVTMTSILLNHKAHDVRFFLFTTGFSEEHLAKINELKKIHPCEISYISVKEHLHYFEKTDTKKSGLLAHISLATYYRFLLFKTLPQDVDRCVYVDGDMVLDADISSLYESVAEDKLLGAVAEFVTMQARALTLADHKKMPEFANFFKDSKKYPYFNAGFFIVNLDMAKKEGIFEKLLAFLDKNPNPPFADQDALNAVLGQCYGERIVYFPPEYNIFCDELLTRRKYDENAFYDIRSLKSAAQNPKIFHYVGAHKPWSSKIPCFYAKWWVYARQSPYPYIDEPPYSFLEDIKYTVNTSLRGNLKKILPQSICLLIRKFRMYLARNKR